MGDLSSAFRLNPLVVVATSVGMLWIGGYVLRRGRPPSRSLSTRWIVVVITCLLLGNWVYLIVTRHQDPALML